MENEELERIARDEREWEIHGSQKRMMNAYDRMPGSQKRRIEKEEAALLPGRSELPAEEDTTTPPDEPIKPHIDTFGPMA